MSTVWDDVAFGQTNMQLSEEEVKGRVADAIHLAGIEGYEQNAPHHLSFGEKKRVSDCARARDANANPLA